LDGSIVVDGAKIGGCKNRGRVSRIARLLEVIPRGIRHPDIAKDVSISNPGTATQQPGRGQQRQR